MIGLDRRELPIVVIKVGSNIAVCSWTKNNIAEQIERLWQNYNVILVSSGAIRTGLTIDTDYSERDIDKLSMPQKQRLALMGQPVLIMDWIQQFMMHNLYAGQILTDTLDLDNELGKENIIQAVWECFLNNTVPIFNENDAVATKEIIYGDNDFLAVDLAKLLDAEKVIFVTGAFCLMINGEPIAKVLKITDELREHLRDCKDNSMKSKIEAIDICFKADISAVLASGNADNDIFYAVTDTTQCIGTIFESKKTSL